MTLTDHFTLRLRDTFAGHFKRDVYQFWRHKTAR